MFLLIIFEMFFFVIIGIYYNLIVFGFFFLIDKYGISLWDKI